MTIKEYAEQSALSDKQLENPATMKKFEQAYNALEAAGVNQSIENSKSLRLNRFGITWYAVDDTLTGVEILRNLGFDISNGNKAEWRPQ